MIAELKELWRYRELLLVMVQRDLKIRYKNSALGFVWSFLNPLLTVGVMTFVYTNFIFKDQPNMGAYIMAAYLPFMFFQMCILDSAQSVLVAMPLIKKIYFPREILPLASIFSNFINLLLAFVIFFAYLLIRYFTNPVTFPIKATAVWLPVLLLITWALATGCSLIICALNTFYEDIKYIMGVLLYLLFFICPVLYFSEQVANSAINHSTNGLIYKIYNLNPIGYLCTAYKKILLDPITVTVRGSETAAADPMRWDYLGVAAVTSFAVLIFGYYTFNRLKWRFVERP
ncbi:MAG: hypothetical protein BGO01_14545 [Armatimonadetes bacterium 55-13]|nr:ABC transporter permease [Armatimonadota bacterium]OJU64934.1 MAG: hypothetical protein BGO01_14545 [Armatimonadetes bacterium 55-13]